MIDLLPGVQSTAAALDAERTRLNVIAENIANANTTRGPDGQPYRRQVVVFETALQQAMNGAQAPVLKVAGIEKDPRPFQTVYDPGNPDADANGMVALPNVNVQEEMADLIAASRAFEANLAVVKNARAMALQVLSIAKH
ncbi:MAG TPA: flagellar basal body rod protein FlgC [Verrucomicrobiae bacterium]|nr:flagellar basal body rod protein FlgC [Verrucomicrobiae bacterium]